VQPTPFAEALEALCKPLVFAAADDFARLERVRALERTVHQAALRLLALRVPSDVKQAVATVAERFADGLEGEARRQAVADVLRVLEPLREPDLPERLLARPLSCLPGVGPRRAERLARRGLGTVVDLLFQLPARYDDRRQLTPVGKLEVGRRATFVGEVLVAGFVPLHGRRPRLFQAVVGDASGTVKLKWFRGGEAVQSTVRKGARLRVTGEVRRYRFDKEITHAEVDRLEEGADPREGAIPLVPVYAAVEGFPARTFRRLVAAAVAQYSDLVASTLPPRLTAQRELPTTSEALRQIHAPAGDADLPALVERRSPAHERLVLEELYLLELGLALRRAEYARQPGLPVVGSGKRVAQVTRGLPFQLTAAQQSAWKEIRHDLGLSHPMSRLLQGDVGSGKTVVAALAAVAVAEAGYQTALMAPTELLAEQHARTLQALLAGDPGMRLGLLTASAPGAAAVRVGLADGDIDLVVGTHALVQTEVRFARLGLVVVDEQHRFGVLQRAALAAKAPAGQVPHTLVMTATPIPRSLALTLYGDLDLSVIDTLPPGRSPAKTLLLREGEGPRVVELIRDTLERGEQVYVVYPLVEVSEKLDLRAATESAQRIRAAFPKASVELVHGRMDAAARAAAMQRFERGEAGLLVSTTVIEVGVDIQNATLMVVEHAERFGLAQLHQLRGRVGRGRAPGTCVLVARGGTEDSEARLRAMLESTDGFVIADADLRIRGPGEFLGTRQHGRLPDLHFADLDRDARLVSLARNAAQETLRGAPRLANRPSLARAVKLRWGDRLSLVGVA